MGWRTNLGLVGCLATWYAFTSPSEKQLSEKKSYPLPEKIEVVETSLPSRVVQKVTLSKNSNYKKVGLVSVVETKDIDFSKNFKIRLFSIWTKP